MGPVFLIAIVAVPILEIVVFIEVGGRLGAWPTVGAVILTAMVGVALLRLQGLAALFRVRESLERGRFPIDEVFDGLCLLVAGGLLLIPGFVTDAAGLLLFVPALRRGLRRSLGRRVAASGKVVGWTVDGRRNGFTVIDGEYHEVPPEDDGRRGNDDGSPPALPG